MQSSNLAKRHYLTDSMARTNSELHFISLHLPSDSVSSQPKCHSKSN